LLFFCNLTSAILIEDVKNLNYKIAICSFSHEPGKFWIGCSPTINSLLATHNEISNRIKREFNSEQEGLDFVKTIITRLGGKIIEESLNCYV
jgi:hypothetical protein